MHLESFPRPGKLLALAFTLLCFQAPQSGNAATPVCGLVEAETWTPEGSPYLVMCDVQVDSLVIHPGVVVQFESNYVFQVTGFLMATGAVFTTTNTAAGWEGIFFNEVAPQSSLDSCTIEGSANSGVRIKNCLVTISNCLFRSNSAAEGGGINIDNTLAGLGQLAISGCTFSNNTSSGHGGGVRANVANNSIRFTSCAIVNNAAGSSGIDASRVGGGLYVTGESAFNNCLIAGNVVTACTDGGTRLSRGGGIYLNGDADSVLNNCLITNNTARMSLQCGGSARQPEAYGGGVFLADGTLTLRNCIIAYNNLSGSLNSASGAGMDTGSGRAVMENCTVVYNTISIASSRSGISAGSTTAIRNSIIFFNSPEEAQLSGTTNVFYSDVQGGVLPGPGNKSVQPSLDSTLRITANSQCVDMGDPDSIYNDVCFPPSRGAARNDMGAHGGPGACCWDAPCEANPCPVLGTLQGQVSCTGMSATLCVTATSAGPLSYQWRYHGTSAANPPMDIPNATNSCLTLGNLETNDAGYYSLQVASPSCIVESNPALLLVFDACVSLNLYPGLSITGQVGRAYCVQYTTDLLSTNTVWTSLTNFTLDTPEYFYVDPQPARSCDNGQVGPPRRFYRVIEGACP